MSEPNPNTLAMTPQEIKKDRSIIESCLKNGVEYGLSYPDSLVRWSVALDEVQRLQAEMCCVYDEVELLKKQKKDGFRGFESIIMRKVDEIENLKADNERLKIENAKIVAEALGVKSRSQSHGCTK